MVKSKLFLSRFDGHIENIYLLDKKTIARNKVQVIKQFEQAGSAANRYDVTILVNGLPLGANRA
jgi:type I restriction enzyme R subunit